MSTHRIHGGNERQWAEEVLHLHALWHQGPPRNPSSNPKPFSPKSSLRPAPSAAFKKEPSSSFPKKKKSRPKNKKKERRAAKEAPSTDPPPVETGWPVLVSPDPKPQDNSWSDLTPQAAAAQRPPATAEEQARAAANSAQSNGLKAAKDFFSKDGSDDDEDEDMDEEDEEERGTSEFFCKLFKNDTELREHYEKNCEKGEFFCLVCGGIGAKVGKRFGNAVALVQHANSVSKTKRKEAHRTFARAVCQVLGWDINRLPSFDLAMGETLGQPLSKSQKAQEEMEKGSIEKDKEIQTVDVGGKEKELMPISDPSEATALEIPPIELEQDILQMQENEQQGVDAPAAQNGDALGTSMQKEKEDSVENKDDLSLESKNEDELSNDNLGSNDADNLNHIHDAVKDDGEAHTNCEDHLSKPPFENELTKQS